MPYIIDLKKIRKEDVKAVGGKAANCGELMAAGFPMPAGFVVTVEAYEKFLQANDLRKQIEDMIKNADLKNFDALTALSQKIKTIILNATMPQVIKDSIIFAYKDMMYDDVKQAGKAFEFIKAGRDIPFVAVRSSAVTEDVAKASSAGQQETFLNIRGGENVCYAVQKVWASLFTPRAIYYRDKHGLPQEAGIAVIAQKMINSEKSGVMFTIDPATEKDNIVIEACFGLGETIVQGEVTPDRYVVDKKTGKILEKNIGIKTIERVRDIVSGLTVKQNVPEKRKEAQVLSDDEIITIAAYGKKIEQHYNFPQDIEFAIERGRIYIVQTRAVTTRVAAKEKEEVKEGALIKGLGASPGSATGVVKIIRDLKELHKIEKGDILVTEMTNPDMVPAMEKAAGIVTDKGGTTSHAAIVSRELGIPCIVGTGNATQLLKEGEEVTVDATQGIVYRGVMALEPIKISAASETPQTATKIKVNLAFPETAKEELAKRCDGVGLLRIEHMLTKTGMHPVEFIRQGKSKLLTSILIDGIGKIARVFYPKPVWVRSLDARTDEFSHMQGGEAEPKEANPMLGWHGIRRSLDEPEIVKAELAAIKELHMQGFTNVAVMLPFVISVSELKRAKEIAKQVGLPESVKIGCMIETPAACMIIDEFCKEGIDFISFGSNDLCQLTLGIDRNNEKLAKLFDEMHPSMQKLFKQVIETCKCYSIETSICGELPSNRRDAVEFLIKTGIDSISVNIDALDKARGWAIEIEKHNQ